jgi:hypothetical protein
VLRRARRARGATPSAYKEIKQMKTRLDVMTTLHETVVQNSELYEKYIAQKEEYEKNRI